MTATRQFNKRQSRHLNSALSAGEKEWMTRMRTNALPETMTVLFAKSIAEVPKKPSTLTTIRAPSYKKAQSNSRSISPQKRLKTDSSEAVSLNSPLIRSDQYKSTIRIPSSSCESLVKPIVNYRRRRPSPNSSLPVSSSSSCESLNDRGRKFAYSMPSVASLSLRKADNNEPKVRMRQNRNPNSKNSAYRHTIRIGDEIFNNCTTGILTKCSNTSNANSTNVSTRSPNSSESSFSVDSGQCSGRLSKNAQTAIMSDSAASSDFSNHLKSSLPSYARMASTLDHVLRTANTIYSLLDSNLDDPKVARELMQKVQIYIQILQQSPCQPFLAEADFTLVSNTLLQVGTFNLEQRSQAYLKALDYSNVVVRRMLEQSLIVLLRITTNYLNECTNRDRLLVIALEHLVHLLLFGDELCLEAIRCKAVDNIVGFCRQSTTSNDTLRLLLRVLAVLCGVGRGCLQLISIGGLDLIIQLFNSRPVFCATEAAGILTQLTSNPNHPFIRLACTQLDKMVDRLLELIDECRNAESLLLCSAALANFSLLNTAVVKMLYERNAIQRLVNALGRSNNTTIFIQEQIVIIFSQLAICSYDQALVAQGAIPVLLKMLRVGESVPQRFGYSNRIRYKAIVCLSTIASNSLGLKSIYENYGCQVLEMVLQREQFSENSTGNSPFLLVCANIRNQLRSIYHTPKESAV